MRAFRGVSAKLAGLLSVLPWSGGTEEAVPEIRRRTPKPAPPRRRGVNRTREADRRRRQIERGMLRPESRGVRP